MTVDEDRNKDRFQNWQLCGVWMLPFCLHRATKLTQNCACFTNPQTRNQLVTPGEKSFLRGVQIFELCSTHFPGGQKTFQGGFAPLLSPWLRACQYVYQSPFSAFRHSWIPPKVLGTYCNVLPLCFFLYGGLLLALYNYNGLVAPRLSCTISGFILLGLFSWSGCVPCSSSAFFVSLDEVALSVEPDIK